MYDNEADIKGDTGERQPRRIVSALIERGVLLPDSSRAAAPRILCLTRVSLDARPVSGTYRITSIPKPIRDADSIDVGGEAVVHAIERDAGECRTCRGRPGTNRGRVGSPAEIRVEVFHGN